MARMAEEKPHAIVVKKMVEHLVRRNEHHGSVSKGFESSLKALGIEYIDLYVRPLFPVPSIDPPC